MNLNEIKETFDNIKKSEDNILQLSKSLANKCMFYDKDNREFVVPVDFIILFRQFKCVTIRFIHDAGSKRKHELTWHEWSWKTYKQLLEYECISIEEGHAIVKKSIKLYKNNIINSQK